MATYDDFAKFMVTLGAAIPRFAPDVKNPSTLKVWFAEIGHLDVPQLREIYKTCVRSHDAFPSMRQILQLAGQAEAAPEEKGREIADRIWIQLSKGRASSLNPDAQKLRDEFVGPIGLQVVQMNGGWLNLAENVMEENATVHKAQWRESAAHLIRKGGLGEAPTYDALPSNEVRRQIAGEAAKHDMSKL